MPRSQLKSLKGQGKKRQNINQQLITGRVYDVILDKNHPFFERKLGGIFDASISPLNITHLCIISKDPS